MIVVMKTKHRFDNADVVGYKCKMLTFMIGRIKSGPGSNMLKIAIMKKNDDDDDDDADDADDDDDGDDDDGDDDDYNDLDIPLRAHQRF